MSSWEDYSKTLMYKAIMSEKTNGIVCECETHPEKGWVKWYDSQDRALFEWYKLIQEFEEKDQFTMYYPKDFVWEDGTPDPGEYALVYNKKGEQVYYLHIICQMYDDVDQYIFEYALNN